MLTSEQKLLAALSHGSPLIGLGIIAPLIIMLVSKDDYIKVQAKEALVFQLVMLGAGIISGILVIVLIGILGLICVGIVSAVFAIIALISVIDGKDYSYPITGKWARNL